MQKDSFFDVIVEHGINERLDELVIRDKEYQKLQQARNEVMQRQQ